MGQGSTMDSPFGMDPGVTNVDVTFPNGSRYKGQARYAGTPAQQQHGHGHALFKGQGEYKGMWSEGTRHGRGTELYVNKIRYEGEFHGKAHPVAGVMGARHGPGTVTLSDGFGWEGTWNRGVPSGKGTWRAPDGMAVAGDFHEFHLAPSPGKLPGPNTAPQRVLGWHSKARATAAKKAKPKAKQQVAAAPPSAPAAGGGGAARTVTTTTTTTTTYH